MDACGNSAIYAYLSGTMLWLFAAVLLSIRKNPVYNDQSVVAIRGRTFAAAGLSAAAASLIVAAWVNYGYCADEVPLAQRPRLIPLLQVAIFLAVLSYGKVHEFFLSLRNRRLVENLPTSKCRSVAMGLVEVAGRAAGEETVSGASGLPAYYTRACVECGTNFKGRIQWNLLADEVHATPFFLEDGSGRVLVDPAGAELRVDNVFTYSGETGLFSGPGMGTRIRKAGMTLEQIQGHLEQYCREVVSSGRHLISLPGAVSPAGLPQPASAQPPLLLRVREFILGPGDPVYVLGTAREHPGTGEADRVVIAKGEHHPWFVIASGSQREVLLALTAGSGVLLFSGFTYGITSFLMFAWAFRWI